jgi:hypothetical protein
MRNSATPEEGFAYPSTERRQNPNFELQTVRNLRAPVALKGL